MELTQPSKKLVPGLFLGVKRPWPDADNPTPPSAKVKKESSCASTRPLGQFCVLRGDFYLHIEKFSSLVHKKHILSEMKLTQNLKTDIFKIPVNIKLHPLSLSLPCSRFSSGSPNEW
jgi:hypothetical protein